MRVFFSFSFGLALLLCAAMPAGAQRRGDRALFGGGVGSAEQVLSVSSSLGASFYDPLTKAPDIVEPRLLDSSVLSVASGQLSYRLGLRFLTINANLGGSGIHYSPPINKWYVQALYNAAVGTNHTWQLSPKTHLSANASVGYQPAYWDLTAAPGQLGSAGSGYDPERLLPPDVTALTGSSLDAFAGLSLGHALSRRVSLSGDYSFSRRLSFGRQEAFDYFSNTVSAAVNVSLTRHLSVHGGYSVMDSQNGPPGSPHIRSQGATAGIDYNRGGSLQLTRKTTLTFSGGASGITDTSGSQHYFFLGNVRLSHEMGRTWSTSVGFDRNLQFSSLFLEPILADTVSADLGGLISSRLSFRSVVAYSRGAVGFTGGDNGFDRANAYATLQSGLTRYLAVGAAYAYYDREIGTQVATPSDIARRSRSQMVMVFANAWAPLFQRARRPNATR